MTLRELADSLIRETQDMRWQDARDSIEAALHDWGQEMYQLGFLDGERSVKDAKDVGFEGAEIDGVCV